MSKRVFIAEKPSVAREFAASLGLSFTSRDGYMEAEDTIVTWCVGHLVTMCYPDAYDPKYKKWSLSTIPFIPDEYRYQVIDGVKKQFGIVKRILTDKDVDTIYICTDSGREGEYIYRLVAQQAGVKDKKQLRVWIDSQTKEEILRGIREAKEDSEYDNLGAAAYLRAKEDYLMGINFSRALTLKYGDGISRVLGTKYSVIAVGRVMTCVLGMVVRREREIRDFVKTPFYRVLGKFRPTESESGEEITAEWHAVEGSRYFGTPALYKENGFKERKDAEALIGYLQEPIAAGDCEVKSLSRKKEKKNPPLLYNLAELQNDCSRFFKISPDQTLQAAQELYEKKLTTYPRTDARVLSSAVAKEIGKNLKGLSSQPMYRPYLQKILDTGSYKTIGKTRYTDDKAITDHYAIIPTGQGQIMDLLMRAGLTCKSFATGGSQWVHTMQDMTVRADHMFSAKAVADYDAIVVPGGRTAAAPLIANDEVMDTLRTFDKAGKLVGGLCSGTTVLEASGVLAGHRATGYTGYGAKLTSAQFVADQIAVWDGNIVTSQGPCAPYPFAFKFMEAAGINPQPIKDRLLYDKACGR